MMHIHAGINDWSTRVGSQALEYLRHRAGLEKMNQMLSKTEAASWAPLVCPAHGRRLVSDEGMLRCEEGDAFQIVNLIPRFVGSSTYADNFGAQWNKYRLTQLDSFTGLPITRDRLRRCLGEDLWNSLAGKQVLECGCGAGRFTEILLERGAFVTSVDLSTAVDANATTFPVSHRHRIAQADILHLPFAPRQFDVVLCLGVIQHTPNPTETIAALYQQVAPGGSLVIDHYTFEWARVTSVKPIFRFILKRTSPRTAMAVIERMVDVLLPWHKSFRNSGIAWKLLSRVSPLTTYYRAIPELNEDLQRQWALLDTHDSLTDWYKHLRTVPQIRKVFESIGARDVWCKYGGNGVEAGGRR